GGRFAHVAIVESHALAVREGRRGRPTLHVFCDNSLDQPRNGVFRGFDMHGKSKFAKSGRRNWANRGELDRVGRICPERRRKGPSPATSNKISDRRGTCEGHNVWPSLRIFHQLMQLLPR